MTDRSNPLHINFRPAGREPESLILLYIVFRHGGKRYTYRTYAGGVLSLRQSGTFFSTAHEKIGTYRAAASKNVAL